MTRLRCDCISYCGDDQRLYRNGGKVAFCMDHHVNYMDHPKPDWRHQMLEVERKLAELQAGPEEIFMANSNVGKSSNSLPRAKHIARNCRDYVNTNQECFIAQWILQNPDERIDDWVMAHGVNDKGQYTFTMERKTK